VYLLFERAILLSQNYVSVTVALLKRQPKTGECWLQLWVSCTVVRRRRDCTPSSAPTTNVSTRLDSTHVHSSHGIDSKSQGQGQE